MSKYFQAVCSLNSKVTGITCTDSEVLGMLIMSIHHCKGIYDEKEESIIGLLYDKFLDTFDHVQSFISRL